MALPVRYEMGSGWGGHDNLEGKAHEALALWAADCAKHVLHYFEEEHPDDDRPRKAVEAARAWTRDEVTVGEAREVALATHEATRGAEETAAREAARAAGHAVAIVRVDDHAKETANYAIKAVIAGSPDDTAAADTERERQFERLPERLRSVVTTDRRND